MFDILKRIIHHPITSFKHPGSILHPTTWCNKAYVDYLKSKGAIIGEGSRFISPAHCNVDVNRAEYISIGKNCCLSFVTLLAHDYSWYVFAESHHDILPDGGGKIVIGNNCFIGYQATILKNTTIGDNVIIGARAVVKGNVPSNTVWAGCPAKQICTLDELYQKRVMNKIEAAIYRRDLILEKKHRAPTIKEMGMFAFLFLARTEENYEEYIRDIQFNGIRDCSVVRALFFESQPFFPSFEDFLNYE